MGNNTSKKPATVENRTPEQKETIVDESETKAENEHRQISVLIVGAGMRGQIYATYSKDFPNRMNVVGVAEPVFQRRSMMQNVYKIEKENVFDDWKDAASKDKFADAVVIATLDHMHKEPAIAFANKGYHILLEKPMAPTLADCEEIVEACKRNKIILAVGHVLRYTPHYLKVKEIIDSGKIGEIVNIQHMEPVGWNHYAHSYVRGNWRREEDTGSSLLAKCCHDIDLLNYFMSPSQCISVSSFGSLSHFKKSNKPDGAGKRCTDCSIEAECPYSAVKMYLAPAKFGFPNFFCFVVADNPTPEEIEESLKTGPYGRCVYDCDNDVMSNQVVNMIFEGGKTINMSMIAFTEKLCVRQTKVFGTHGEMTCSESSPITVFDFATKKRQTFYEGEEMPVERTTMLGHGGADYHLMKAFVKAVAFEDPGMILSGPDESLASHRLVFLAEVARKENRVVDVHATEK